MSKRSVSSESRKSVYFSGTESNSRNRDNINVSELKRNNFMDKQYQQKIILKQENKPNYSK